MPAIVPYQVLERQEFTRWFDSLRDRVGQARIAARLVRLKNGDFGDAKSVGGNVSELRFHFGPGYRVYFTRRADGRIVILVAGGDKATQSRDIERAKRLAVEER